MKRLSLHQLSSLAEIASAIAVIVSLIYLATELDQNTTAVKADAVKSIMASAEGPLLAIAQDGELADLMARALRNPAGLTAGERLQLFYFQLYRWRTLSSALVQHEIGVLGEAQWDLLRRLGCRPMSPMEKTMWPRHKELLGSTFIRFIEGCGAVDAYDPQTAPLPLGPAAALPRSARTGTAVAVAQACRTLGGELEIPQKALSVGEARCRFPDGSGRRCDANGSCEALHATGPAPDPAPQSTEVADCGPCRESCMQGCSAERPLRARLTCVRECVQTRCREACEEPDASTRPDANLLPDATD